MKPIQIAQKGLEEATAKQIEAYGAACRYAQIIADEKEAYVRKKLMDKEFLCEDLLSPDESGYDWTYADFKDHIFKVVSTKMVVSNWMIRDSYSGGEKYDPLDLYIAFLRDPDEILNSNKKLTETEIKILKRLKKGHAREYGYCDYDILEKEQGELCKLKHKINLLITLHWSFTFETITKEDFIEQGLVAESKIL